MFKHISKLSLAVFVVVFISPLAFSQTTGQIPSPVNPVKQPVYAQIDKARELASVSLARSGRKNVAIGEIRDLGAVHVVRVIDRSKKDTLVNELFIRKDGAVMPVYGTPINGRPRKEERIENTGAARGLAAFWLWQTGQKTLQVGSVQQTNFTYIVNLHPKEKTKVLANQLIVRKNGLLLPVGNGKIALMACIGCGGPGGGGSSFGWFDDMMLPEFDDIDPGDWGNDWGSGWWGSDWGWGWGSSDSWTPPGQHDTPDCDGMTPEQCQCLRTCHNVCENKPPESNCFEHCADQCGFLCCFVFPTEPKAENNSGIVLYHPLACL